ncbi:PAS domain-containing sensor histidine kinase [Pedobacter sp. CFBP9032]|uniref:PAS domain-containing sensor histidine kinase n=1 Tax=Pedobacter sp. CFBP9032 TaxID=3096539 RepID=UPI002A6A4BE5|nr:ATP-binding protein [Pedobacter sp. CFBP9032]MDY0906705.1 PAS domain-containing protein [Pedobacter sp. CFBP9032]
MHQNLTDKSDFFNILIEESEMPIGLYEGENFIIRVANKAILKAWGKDAGVIGMEIAEALPEILDQPFLHILKNVFQTGVAYEAKEDKVVLSINGSMQTFYFDFVYKPLFNEEGKVWAILNNATDVTELVNAKFKCKESEELFRQMIYDAPIAIGILRGEDFIIEDANVDLLKIWGKTNQVIGLKLFDGLPEIVNQAFPKILEQVYKTGEAHYGYETLARLERNGIISDYYFNFVYDPIFDQEKKVSGIMIVANEITAQVVSRLELQESEERFKNLVLDNPVPTAFYETENIVIKIANNEMLKLWGKSDKIIGLPMGEGIPELVGQPFIPLLQEVYRTGIPYHADQQEATLVLDGVPTTNWYNFTYKPLRDAEGKVFGVLHAAIDVTRQVQLQHQKDEFLGIASHELKTPVTSIKAYAQVLEKMIRAEGDEKKAGMVRKMDLQLNRLTGLIGDLLDVTKIQAGKITFNAVAFDFDQLIYDMVEEMQHTTSQHHLNATLNSKITVIADRERIGQVVTNFLSNAIKYSVDADSIIVKSYRMGDEVILSVQDYGIGISENLQKFVFDQFYRVSGNQQHTYPGLGLGLYISAEIIKNEGGRIWVESTEGSGSTFYFALKIKK